MSNGGHADCEKVCPELKQLREELGRVTEEVTRLRTAILSGWNKFNEEIRTPKEEVKSPPSEPPSNPQTPAQREKRKIDDEKSAPSESPPTSETPGKGKKRKIDLEISAPSESPSKSETPTLIDSGGKKRKRKRNDSLPHSESLSRLPKEVKMQRIDFDFNTQTFPEGTVKKDSKSHRLDF